MNSEEWTVKSGPPGATIVISGSGRGAGKTAVGCGLIQAFPDWAWTAVKITPDLHGGEAAGAPLPWVFVEKDRESPKGTGRYLAAGARRTVLLTVDPEWDGRSFAELDAVIDEGSRFGNLLVESNRFSGNAKIYLAVIDKPAADWKHSFQRCVDRADALVLTGSVKAGDLPERLREKPIFSARDGEWAPAELVLWVRGRLCDRSGSGC